MRPGRARAAFLLATLALASLSISAYSTPVGASPYHPFAEQANTTSALERVTETNQRVAQSFVPTANFTLTRAALYVRDRGNSNALTVRLLPDAGGRPNEASILATGSNDTSTAYEWADFDLAPAVTLVSGAPYWILADSPGGNGDGYAWRYVNADLYPMGNASSAVANTWTTLPGDLAFVLYGWTPADVSLRVTADRGELASGDVVQYTIALDNAGTEDATDVWVNSTLDGLLELVNVSGPGAVSVLGSVVSIRPAVLPTGTTAFALTASAGSLLDDGAFLPLPVTAEFTAQTRRAVTATELVEIRAPRLVAAIAVEGASARPGAVLAFAVTLTNEGRETARHVWLNETLHPDLTYLQDSSAVPPDQDGPSQSWHFLDVAPGATTFSVTVQVDPRTADETVVTNFLSVEYTDGVGIGGARGRSNTITLVISGGGASPWLWGSFAISATLVGSTYVLYARRRLRTEEIFLIHQSGVLLVHMSKTLKADHDSDILSGMFTAIMSFVRDAFHYEGRQELHGMDLGEYRVHVRKGAFTYLAIVHTGKPNAWISRTAARAVQDVESQHGEMLRDWDGAVQSLGGVRDILRGYFLSPTGPSPSRGWIRAMIARLDQSFKPMRPL